MMRAALLAIAVLGCQREEREFSPPSPGAGPLSLAPLANNYVGGPPILGAPVDPQMPDYRETAYQISQGAHLYRFFNCIGCHAGGGGAMGPALMDERWRYGSEPHEIARSIVAGRPDGMPSYRGKVTSVQLYALVAYVRALGGLTGIDRVPARGDHMKAIPPLPLRDRAVPVGSQGEP